jgi:5-methylcytosine-specific restriction endonuclease McrA
MSEIHTSYASYLESARWHFLRSEALARDGFRCRVCDARGGLQVHHRRYPAAWGEEAVEDLTSLCWRCHECFHKHLKLARQVGTTHQVGTTQQTTGRPKGGPSPRVGGQETAR